MYEIVWSETRPGHQKQKGRGELRDGHAGCDEPVKDKTVIIPNLVAMKYLIKHFSYMNLRVLFCI